LYAEFFPFVWRSLSHLGVSREQLDDAAQDVFVVVLQKLGDFEGRSSLKTWIFGITHLVSLSYFRSEKRGLGHLPIDQYHQELPRTQRGPHEVVAHAEDAAFLRNFLDGLDEKQRTVFAMADIEEMTAPEIAEALGVNLNTIYSRLRLARAAFRQALQAYDRGQP